MKKIIIITLIFSLSLHAMQKEEPILDRIAAIDPEKQTTENAALREYVEKCIATDRKQLNNTLPGFSSGPLHIAAQSDHNNKILSNCLMNGALVNACTAIGSPAWTPLMLACDYRARENVRLLLVSKAETNAMDNENKTALHYICNPALDSSDHKKIERRFAIAELLLNHGADANAIDKDKMTPLCYVATTYFGGYPAPATHTLSAEEYTLFLSQRKALISLLLLHKAEEAPALERAQKKLNNDATLGFLAEFHKHIKNPSQLNNCSLN